MACEGSQGLSAPGPDHERNNLFLHKTHHTLLPHRDRTWLSSNHQSGITTTSPFLSVLGLASAFSHRHSEPPAIMLCGCSSLYWSQSTCFSGRWCAFHYVKYMIPHSQLLVGSAACLLERSSILRFLLYWSGFSLFLFGIEQSVCVHMLHSALGWLLQAFGNIGVRFAKEVPIITRLLYSTFCLGRNKE